MMMSFDVTAIMIVDGTVRTLTEMASKFSKTISGFLTSSDVMSPSVVFKNKIL